MSLYLDYLNEIEDRKVEGLHPLPIDKGDLLAEIITQIKDTGNEHREASLNFFIYNTLPGTTNAAGVKSQFLKEIILGQSVVAEITPEFALELLSHMKGGPSVEVLLDLALSDDASVATPAAEVLKTQVFLYVLIQVALKRLIKRAMQSLKNFWKATQQLSFSLNCLTLQKKLKLSLILQVKAISQLIYFLRVIKHIHVLIVSYMANV